MIRVFATILSLCILVLSSNQSIILLNYAVNKNYIAKNLCENRSKPKMNCNGKCHLKKQLQKEEKKDRSPFGVKEKVELQLFSSSCKLNPLALACIKIDHAISSNKNYTSLNQGSVFHPPRA